MKTALSIAGTDPTGGAGAQADIKTMTANGVYAMSVITSLVAQNTLKVSGILDVDPEFIGLQMDSVFEDIYPNAVKTGMISSPEIIRMVGDKLKFYGAKNIVVDPVMVATNGAKLIQDEAIEVLKSVLFPLSHVITPNIPEGEILSGMEIKDDKDMEKAANTMYERYGCSVLLKGGHKVNDANDLLYYEGQSLWIQGERIDNPNTHGTGCTLSSAIASNLAKGYDLPQAVKNSKAYISGALKSGLDLGKGSGPLNHGYMIK